MRDDVDTLIAADAGDTGPHQAAFSGWPTISAR
jgi:hypothetical protein